MTSELSQTADSVGATTSVDTVGPSQIVDSVGPTQIVDSVDRAAASPDQPQPFRELGLKDDEYERIREILGRRPTDAELAMYSVMWSEHCSYKSSKVHLRYFGETTTEKMRTAMLAVEGGGTRQPNGLEVEGA